MGYQKQNPQKNKVTQIFDLIEDGAAEDLLELSEKTEVAYLKEFEEDALEYLNSDGKYLGISTGYQGVDNLLGSFLPGELLTIGGDTGHGKSLLAMNIAQNVYQKYQEPVLLVNLELTRNQAVQRFYNLSGDDHDYAGILIQRAPAVAYRDIDVLMQKAKDEKAVLVIIDHLHFFNDAIGDNQAHALTRIVKHFKECAVQHELPVILLSHVTPTMKADGSLIKPDLHNFKGSRSIEQLSDMVGFVFRDKETNEMEFYTRKNRSRPLNPQTTRFEQNGWKLEEQTQWLPQNIGLQQHGESSRQDKSPLSTKTETVNLNL
jgi:replicative DNA helicase